MRTCDYIYHNRDKITFPCGADSFVVDCDPDDTKSYLIYNTGWVLTDVDGYCDHPGKVCITKNDFGRIISQHNKKLVRRNSIRKFFGPS